MLKAGTPFPSIQLMVRDPADFTDREVKTRMIYNAAGVFVDPIDNPTAAATTCFPTMTAGSSGPGQDRPSSASSCSAADAAGELNSELNALMPKLCTEDRTQLQALQDGWNNLYSSSQAAATAAASARRPARRSPSTTDFPTNAKLQMDILALALACDLTRVASLQFSTSTSQVTHTWLGSNQTDMPPQLLARWGRPRSTRSLAMHQATTTWASAPAITDMYAANNLNLYQRHRRSSRRSTTSTPRRSRTWRSKLNGITGAAAAARCSISRSSAGGTSSTWARPTTTTTRRSCWSAAPTASSRPARPGHLPARPDRRQRVGRRETNDRSHNDLLLTLAKVMGTPMSTFGEPTYCTGPITEILNPSRLLKNASAFFGSACYPEVT